MFEYPVCKEMFIARKYKIIAEEEHLLLALTVENKLVSCLSRRKVGMNELKECYLLWEKQHASIRILIYVSITPQAKRLIDDNLPIDLFMSKELMYNVTKHKWVPIHRLSHREHKEKLKYPCIRHNDPVVKFYRFPIGSIIEIIRTNGDLYYRRVV